MITSRPVQNFLADCVSKQLPPQLQPAARKALDDNQLTPLILEAVAKQIEESAVAAAKVGANGSAQNITDLTVAVRAIEKRIVEKDSGEKVSDKIPAAIGDVAEQVDDVRNSLRTLEDKVDTLAPYQIWKVAVVACVALALGAVASWNIRPVYKKWQWEQQQKGGR